MSADDLTLRGREKAEALMTATCRITRKGPTQVLNESTGQYEFELIEVYSGKCKLKQADTQVAGAEAAGQLLIKQDSILSLPVEGTAGVREDDIAELLTNPLDTELVGARYRVKGGHGQSYATARRLPVEVIP